MQSYDLTLAAVEDLRDIWHDTYRKWGFDQAETYFSQIEACCEALSGRLVHFRTNDQLPDGVRVHQCQHHYIFWLGESHPVIIAILHERMDFLRRLKGRLS